MAKLYHQCLPASAVEKSGVVQEFCPTAAMAEVVKLDNNGNIMANLFFFCDALLVSFSNYEVLYAEIIEAGLGKGTDRKRHHIDSEDRSCSTQSLVDDVHRRGPRQDKKEDDILKRDCIRRCAHSA